MGVLETLTHANLRAAVNAYRLALRAHRERLNLLNVYPVPDGDTGTNMALTLDSVVADLDDAYLNGADDMASACKAISRGSLMGARGNSGVILSQVLRGLCEILADAPQGEADGTVVAQALDAAGIAAYGAVMHPVEGTILTVVREAAAAATATAGAGGTLLQVLEAASEAAEEAVAHTPELLPVLAEAGVVDAGGAGFAILLCAFLNVVDGRDLPSPPAATGTEMRAAAGTGGSEHGSGSGVTGGPRYEVMYLLDAPDEAIDSFKQEWDSIGESIVVVGGDGLWNCHIHADDIGAAIEAGIAVGRPRRIAVTDLVEQVQEEQWVRQHLEPEVDRPALRSAVVAVAAGAGALRALRSLGVQEVVEGGQSMNPSTAELLAAVGLTSGEQVIILPNNKNIVAVATQVAVLADRPVTVLPTRSVVEGAAAMLAYDGSKDAAENIESMSESSAHVVCGHVTQAVRDSGEISEGDWLGVFDSDVVVSDRDLVTACCALLDRLVQPSHELITLIEGEGSTDEASADIVKWLAEHRQGAAVETQRWDQPLSAYLFSIE